MYKLLTLTKNTFIETIRQPLYIIIILAALFLFIISPSLAMYTMSDDTKLLRELGLSTLFLTSLFIAIFAASSALAVEIENKTVLTILSKPIRRPTFIISKFLGVTLAVVLAHYICTIALLMSIRHGVLETNADTHDWSVITSAGVAVLLSVLLSAFFNYAYNWRFSSSTVICLAVFGSITMLFLSFIDRNFQFNPQQNGFSSLDIFGCVLLVFAAIIIVAFAIAISTRFNIVVTLSSCIGLFLLGLISDYIFGRYAQQHIWAKIGRFALPNLQVFWISDAIYEESVIPFKYIAITACYAICYTTAILALAIALFQKRQLG